MALIAAEYNGVAIDIPEFTMGEDNKVWIFFFSLF